VTAYTIIARKVVYKRDEAISIDLNPMRNLVIAQHRWGMK